MKKYIKRLLSYSVYRKTLLAYSVSILIITALILASVYGIFLTNIRKNSIEATQQLLNQLVSGVVNLKTDVDNVMSVITTDSKTLKVLQNSKESKQDNYYLFLRLQEIKGSYSYMRDISVINFNNNVCIQTLGTNVTENNLSFAASMLEEKNYIAVRTITIANETENVVSFLEYLPYYHAVVIVDINAGMFQYSVNSNSKEERSVYIIDRDGNAVTENTRTRIDGQQRSAYFYSVIASQKKVEPSFTFDDKEKRQLLFFSKSEEFGWWFIDVLDYSYYTRKFQSVSIAYLSIAMVFLLFCTGISIVFNRRIRKPLLRLADQCKEISESEDVYEIDELQYLDNAIARGQHERYVNQNYIKTQFLRCLVTGQALPLFIPQDKLTELTKQYQSEYYAILLLKIQNRRPLTEEQWEEEFRIYRYTICNLSDEIFERAFCCQSVDLGEDQVAILFRLKKKEISEEYMLCFKQLREFALERIQIVVSGSLGLIVDDPKEISLSYQKAKQFLETNQLIGREELIDANHQVSVNYQEKNIKLVEAVLEYTHGNYSNSELSLKSVSQVFDLSATYLGKIFKSIQGESYAAYVTNLRLEKVKTELLTTSKTVNEIAQENGFTNSTYFATVFKNVYGMTPSAFRNQVR